MSSRSSKRRTSIDARPRADRIAWGALLATIALVPLASGVLLSEDWALSRNIDAAPKLVALALPLLVSTVAWTASLGQGVRLRWSPFTTALGLFAGLVALSTAFAPLPLTAFFGLTGLLTGAITWLACIWLAFLVTQLVTSSQRLKTVSITVVAACGVVAAIGLMQVAEIDPLGIRMTADSLWMLKQGMATLGNPNYTGVLLIAPLSVSLSLAVAEQRRWARLALGGIALVMAALIFGTLARAAWLGMLVVVLIWVVLLGRRSGERRRTAFVIAGLGVLAVVAGVLAATPRYALHRFSSFFGSFAEWSNGRLSLWGDGLRAISDRPLSGAGAELLSQVGYRVQADPFIEGGQRFMMQDPHSFPVLVAALFGIPALVAFVALTVLALKGSLRRIGVDGPEDSPTMYTGWLVGFIGLAIALLFSVTSITSILLVFLALAVLAAPNGRPVTSRVDTRWLAAVVGVVLMLVVTFGAIRTYSASRAAIESRTRGDEALMLRALELAPWDHVLRAEYLDTKIGFEWPVVIDGDTNASRAAIMQLDATVRSAIADFPQELTLYTLLIDLHANAQGTPGYDAGKHRAAIELALQRFGNDPEIRMRAQEINAE